MNFIKKYLKKWGDNRVEATRKRQASSWISDSSTYIDANKKKLINEMNLVHIEHELMRKGCPNCKSKNVACLQQGTGHSKKGMFDVITYYCYDCHQTYTERFDFPKLGDYP